MLAIILVTVLVPILFVFSLVIASRRLNAAERAQELTLLAGRVHEQHPRR